MIEVINTKKQLTCLQAAIQQAVQAALKLADTEDGGTCNFDTPVLKIKIPKRLREGLNLRQCSWGFYKGWYFVNAIPLLGCGDRRTRMAEAAYKSLEAAGYNAAVYYEMD